jgi:hypothetical protein
LCNGSQPEKNQIEEKDFEVKLEQNEKQKRPTQKKLCHKIIHNVSAMGIYKILIVFSQITAFV